MFNTALQATVSNASAEHTSLKDEVVDLAVAGVERHWRLTGKPTIDEFGAYTGYIGTASDVTAESLRNLWPTDFGMYADYVGLPCIMKPAFGGGWKNVHKIHTLDELRQLYDASGALTMMLQEFITWDTYIRVPTIGRRHARAIRYDPAPGGMGGYNQDYDILPRALRDKAEELSLRYNQALGYDMNALEFAVKDGLFYGIDLTNYTPDLDYRSLKDAHFPWAVEKMAGFAIEKALSKERTPEAPDWKSLLLA
jgi:hypothetical protein